MTDRPVFYSFRRCPYAMRARLALAVSQQNVVLREIVLCDKPAAMLELSAKATVPVMQFADGCVLDESMDIMMWALKSHDPERWLSPETGTLSDMLAWIARNDGPFKHHLDRYKYASRYTAETDPLFHRSEGALFLGVLNERLGRYGQLFGERASLADHAVYPFVRQFANTDRGWFDTQPLKHLQKWLDDHLASDLFRLVMKKFPVWSPGDADVLLLR